MGMVPSRRDPTPCGGMSPAGGGGGQIAALRARRQPTVACYGPDDVDIDITQAAWGNGPVRFGYRLRGDNGYRNARAPRLS